jgi:O-antigen/teichoic acid export membrane protein
MSKPISGLKNSIGLHNSTGKISGKALHLVYTSLASTSISISEFALFAIFWTTLRFFIYLGSNNYYISFFSAVREKLAAKKWHNTVFTMILITGVAFSVLSFVFFFAFFKSYHVSLLGALAVISGIILKCLAEFSKANHSVFLAVISEDLTLNVVLLGSFLFLPENPTILFFSQWAIIAYVIAMIVSYFGIVRKFGLEWLPRIYVPLNFFSYFKTGLSLTIYRGHEMTAFFLIRTMGKYFYGEYFVASTHILLQFYNIVKLYVLGTISGYQSKITLKHVTKWTMKTVQELYFLVLKRASLLFAVGIFLGFALKTHIITLFFPNYLEITSKVNVMLTLGIIMFVFEPLHYIFIYNNLIQNKKRINTILIVILLSLSSLSILNINSFIWFCLMITYPLIVQLLFVLQKAKSLKQ